MKINIKGSIIANDDKWIYDYFEMESTCPADVQNIIDKAGGQLLEVEINSGGGDIFAGGEIYTMLKSYQGEVQIKITGLAASISSVIAMAGKSAMSPTAMMIVHNVSCAAQGDYRDMEHKADILKTANESIVSAYVKKTGMSEAELLAMMDKETWLSAKQALDLKLIDEIMFDEKLDLVANYGSKMLSREVIEKIRNTVKNPLVSNTDETDFIMYKNKIEIERMRY